MIDRSCLLTEGLEESKTTPQNGRGETSKLWREIGAPELAEFNPETMPLSPDLRKECARTKSRDSKRGCDSEVLVSSANLCERKSTLDGDIVLLYAALLRV